MAKKSKIYTKKIKKNNNHNGFFLGNKTAKCIYS